MYGMPFLNTRGWTLLDISFFLSYPEYRGKIHQDRPSGLSYASLSMTDLVLSASDPLQNTHFAHVS